MRFSQLECFINLAQTLSFSETAQLYGITQPAISSLIKSLENELGFDLFIRNKRKVILTPSGEFFYNEIKDSLTGFNLSIAQAKMFEKGYSSKIYIGYAGSTFEMSLLPQIIKRYQEKMPNVYLYLKNIKYNELRNSLNMKKVDIIFTYTDKGYIYDELNFNSLAEGGFVCVVPKLHRFARRKKLIIQELDQESIIFLNPIECTKVMSYIQDSIRVQCQNSAFLYADSTIISQTMIKGNMGIAVMPDYLIAKDKDIITIPMDISLRFHYGIGYMKENKRTEIKEFIAVSKAVWK